MATVQLRNPTEGRADFDRKKAAGKTSMGAMRALKRRLSDIVYRCMINDAVATAASPGGQQGTATGSSVTGSHPQPALRRSHFPDPPKPRIELSSRRCLDTEGSHERALRPLGLPRFDALHVEWRMHPADRSA